MYCLPQLEASEFKKKLKSGEIDPQKLMAMTSAERRSFFADIVGETHAVKVNAGFESKLMLKDQQRGLITWAKSVTGIKPEVQRDILSRVNRMTEILQPSELDAFLEDLAAQRLGIGVTQQEAESIARLSKEIENAQADMKPDGTFPSDDARLRYGYARADFQGYIDGLKIAAEARTPKEIVQDIYKRPGESVVKLGGLAKSLKASLDISALLNQGLRTAIVHPSVWYKNTLKTFEDVWKVGKGQEAMREIKADIFSRPNYPTYVKMKLAIGGIEEAYPTSLPERIPGVGRAFKASETAFNGFQLRNRADVADIVLKQAKANGIDITDKDELIGIGKRINSLTGRAHLGRAEPIARQLNNLLFSPRMLKSHIDVLTAHQFSKEATPYQKTMARKDLLKIIGSMALIYMAANAVSPGSAEGDLRSSDAGKIKKGDTRFDYTGGMAGVLTLASRIATFSSKSSTTGQVSPLNSGKFGSQTGVDVFVNFGENKLAPLAGIIRDYLTGADPQGNKPTLPNETKNLFEPLPASTYQELKDNPNSAGPLAGMLANTIGINTNTYSGSATEIAQDKPLVVNQIYKLMAEGDSQAATDLAHSFNEQLKQSIHDEMVKADPQIDPNILDDKVATKWEKNAIYLPSDDQVAQYKTGDTSVVSGTTSNGKPILTEDTPLPSQGVVGTIVTYAHALGTDPQTAFDDIFHGQIIREVTNGTVIVYRMPLSTSQAVKEKRGGNNPTMKLDHTLPLQLGGNNKEDNLRLVPTETWASYTPVEDYLGKALKEHRATKQQAQKDIIDFKNGVKTFDEIQQEIPTP